MPLPSLVGSGVSAGFFVHKSKSQSLPIFGKPLEEIGKLVLSCF